MTKVLPFGDNSLSAFSNPFAFSSTMDYVIYRKRFEEFIVSH